MNWEVDSVLSLMPGYGLYIADTNTFRVRNFIAWPGNTAGLLRIPQGVNQSDINHHVYITGAFAHNGTLQDCNLCPNDRYFPGHRGLKLDCSASTGLSILNPLVESLSDLHTEIGIEILPRGFAAAMTLQGAYSESAAIHLANVVNSVIGPLTDGGEGGSLKLLFGVRGNSIFGINIASIYCGDSSLGNFFSGVTARTTWVDSTDQPNSLGAPNRRVGCSLGGAAFASRNMTRRLTLPFAERIDSDAFGDTSANIYVIRVTSEQPFEIKSPHNPCNGFEVTYTIRNESGGPMGVLIFNGFKTAGFVNPRSGFNRSICFYYDAEFSQWRQQWIGTVDVPN